VMPVIYESVNIFARGKDVYRGCSHPDNHQGKPSCYYRHALA